MAWQTISRYLKNELCMVSFAHWPPQQREPVVFTALVEDVGGEAGSGDEQWEQPFRHFIFSEVK